MASFALPSRPALAGFVILLLTGVNSQAAEPAFAEVGASFLKQHCVECHGPKDPEAGLRLDTITDDAGLLKFRKVVEKVLDRVQAGDMPPADKPRPDPKAITQLLDVVETTFEKADRAAKPDPGRVTMRRLNRVEYANTIRDLVGVDFDPTEDFPSDDIGYGFDNIGDVLMLSPVHLERYLAAAETIMERAIPSVRSKPVERWIGSQYSEPAGPGIPERRFREIQPEKSDSPIHAGPLHTPVTMETDGEFVVKAHLYAETASDQPVRVALLAAAPGVENVGGAATDEEVQTLAGSPAVINSLRPFMILKTFEIKAREAKKSQTIEVRFTATAPFKKIALAAIKWPDDQPAPKLFIDNLYYQGPLDTRPATQLKLLTAAVEQPAPEQIREILGSFLTRAYRRPVSDGERQRLVEFFDAQVKAGLNWEVAAQRTLAAVLVSPKFLFRVEQDDRPTAPESRPLDQFQLASRLSYFLWSTMPDEELFTLARRGELKSQWDAQVRRMLKDNKASALVDNFAMQWLQLQRLKTVAPDAKLFNGFNDELRAAMMRETQLFLGEIIREDRSLLELYDGKFTYLNEPLARHYGIADTAGNWQWQKPTHPNGQPIKGRKFVRVELPMAERGGLLTQASLLTVTSNPTRTSPVKRGRWVLEQVLGTPPPPPPANVPELKEDEQAKLTGSLRQRMEQHRANPNCAMCHARMDPIGFAFENYDAVGRYRTKDGEFPIETAGTLPGGREIKGTADLKAVFREKRHLIYRNLAEKLLTYALGRGLDYSDRPTLARITAAVEQDDRFSNLVLQIVQSDPFLLRRGIPETQEPVTKSP